jgi:chromosome segregation ATPase
MKELVKYLSLITTVGLVSCKAKQALVDKLPPPPVQVKKYPLSAFKNHNVNLTENLVFLWKKETEMTDSQVRDVQLLSKEKDQLESQQRELKINLNLLEKTYNAQVGNLNEQQKDEWINLPDKIEAQKTFVENTRKSNSEKIPILNLDLEKENQKLVEINNNIDQANQELQVEEGKIEKDQNKINDLSKKIEELKITQATSQANILKINTKIKKLEDKLTNAQNELNELEAKKNEVYKDVSTAYDAKKTEEIRIAPELKNLSDRITLIVKKITENVDLLPTPSVTLDIVENKINIQILWRIQEYCKDCETEFSTTKNTIESVHYEEEGGVVEFKLIDQKDTYSFHLVRIKDDDTTGKIFFGGDLTITYHDGQLRFGSLKFQEKQTEL